MCLIISRCILDKGKWAAREKKKQAILLYSTWLGVRKVCLFRSLLPTNPILFFPWMQGDQYLRQSYILIHLVRQCVCLSFTYLLLLSIPGPFFFGTLFLLLFHSFSIFLFFSLTSFRFHYLSGVIPLAPLLPDFSFTLHFVTHFFPLQSVYFPCFLPIGAYDEYGANRKAPWVFFPSREKGKKQVK
jgi:hypothetical protein